MRERIDLGQRSVGEMAENINALFGGETPEAFAGAHAFAVAIHKYLRKGAQ